MKLDHIDLARLRVSPLNVRKHGHGDVESLAHSIRTLGLLQPLLVKEAGSDFDVIAGQRRLKACQLIAQDGEAFPIACMVMEESDDADAIEASFAENIERLPMDELDQYEAFAALIEKGRAPEEIASQFGVTERLVRQRLAIANLDPRILTLYRKEEINGETMRSLTMASKSQQKAWLKLLKSSDSHAPTGRALRLWLTGGQSIKTGIALFDLAAYKGAIVSDLFGEDSYFADPAGFWDLQYKSVADASAAYRKRGWSDVVTIEGEHHFAAYDYKKTTKAEGGKVFILVKPDGEVEVHEGYLSVSELRAAEKVRKKETASMSSFLPKAELTKPAQNYVDLHLHAAVQWNLVGNAFLTLRVVTAHMICGSSLWTIRPDLLRADKPETAMSRMASTSAMSFDELRLAALALIEDEDQEQQDGDRHDDGGEEGNEDADPTEEEGDDDDDGNADHRHGGQRHLIRQGWDGRDLAKTFARLMTLSDEDVMLVMAVAMAESLAVTSPLIDPLGSSMNINMSTLWSADDAFLSLVTSKETLLMMLTDVGGINASSAHKASTGKTIRGVIRQYATGEGRAKVEGWLPPYLMFPAQTYAGHAEDEAEKAQAA